VNLVFAPRAAAMSEIRTFCICEWNCAYGSGGSGREALQPFRYVKGSGWLSLVGEEKRIVELVQVFSKGRFCC
jgi:hypothetical protein